MGRKTILEAGRAGPLLGSLFSASQVVGWVRSAESAWAERGAVDSTLGP